MIWMKMFFNSRLSSLREQSTGANGSQEDIELESKYSIDECTEHGWTGPYTSSY